MGSEHRNAEKSITWEEELPYFPDSDVLIIETSTIRIPQVNSNKEKFLEKLYDYARKILFDMMMIPNKKIIVILGGIVDWLPIYPILEKEIKFEIGKYDVENYLTKYIANVKTGNYYIKKFNSDNFYDYTLKIPLESYEIEGRVDKIGLLRKNTIRNTGNHLVGCTIICKLIEEYWHYNDVDETEIYNSCEITFLPCPSEITSEEGIELLLNEFLDIEPIEISPLWVDTIKLPNQEAIESEIISLYDDISQAKDIIIDLKEKRYELIKYNRLLWTKGKPLENIVFDAFKFLGFKDIRLEKTEELEDGIFDFQTSSDFIHGILEVKGSDKMTSLRDLTQCNKWVEDYLIEGKKTKGIFVPNQNRLNEYPNSRKDRRHFAPNQFEYAEERKICILPTCELFEAIIEKIKNNPEITREKIEEKILNANGLCSLV